MPPSGLLPPFAPPPDPAGSRGSGDDGDIGAPPNGPAVVDAESKDRPAASPAKAASDAPPADSSQVTPAMPGTNGLGKPEAGESVPMTVETCGPSADVTVETTGTSAPVTGPSTPVTGPSTPVTGPSAPVAVETTGASTLVTLETTGTSAPVTGPTTAVTGPTTSVTVARTGATADVAADTTELPLPELPLPEPMVELTGCGAVAEVTDAAAGVTAERAEPAPEPVPVVDGCGVVAAEAAGAEADELAGAGAGAADAAGVTEPVLEPELAVAGWELVEGGEALALEAALLTADVAWETACPTADDPAPEPPWDAPDAACVTVGTADPSADDKPPADGEPPPPELDAADAEPAVMIENAMARPMAATATPAAYKHSRRTLVTTPRVTSGDCGMSCSRCPRSRTTPIRANVYPFTSYSQVSAGVPRIVISARLPYGQMCPAWTDRGRIRRVGGAGRSRGPGGR
jgi:hypothetical protein